MQTFKKKKKKRRARTCEKDRGGASGTMGWEGILVFSIGRRVRKERGLEGIEGRRSEEAFGLRQRGIESEKESGEEVKQRETEEL